MARPPRTNPKSHQLKNEPDNAKTKRSRKNKDRGERSLEMDEKEPQRGTNIQTGRKRDFKDSSALTIPETNQKKQSRMPKGPATKLEEGSLVPSRNSTPKHARIGVKRGIEDNPSEGFTILLKKVSG
jgi:hypothetical protein